MKSLLKSWKTRLLLVFAVVGPGFITANVDNDAGGIYTYSLAGAQYGYSLLWTMIPITVALIVVQEMVARMGVVTGKTLADLIREKFGVRPTFFLLVALVLAFTFTALMAGVAEAVQGGLQVLIDGKPLDFSQTVTYRGMMFTDLPNLIWIFGYFRASWTLRADIVADFTCRLLNHMDDLGKQRVTPQLLPEEASLPRLDWMDAENFNPGYLMRGMHLLPKRLARPEGVRDVLRDLAEGIRYARATPVVLLAVTVVGVTSTFALNFNVIAPAYARSVLDVGAEGLGFLMAAMGVGALTAALVAASSDQSAMRAVQAEFRSPHFRLYGSDDVIGVELGAALKNVITDDQLTPLLLLQLRAVSSS